MVGYGVGLTVCLMRRTRTLGRMPSLTTSATSPVQVIMIPPYRIFSCYPVFRQDRALLKVGRCLESKMATSVPPVLIVTEVWISGVYCYAAECVTITFCKG